MSGDPWYVMTPTEIAWGFVIGHLGALPRPTGPTETPRAALEAVLEPLVARPPCGVAFSGGRDSSLVLAAATVTARRRGLPDPVPITRRFPADDESHEAEWQELVVRHLGLREWERIVLHDELDVLGPLAQRHLLAHGVLWPASLAVDLPLLERLRGGTLIDGEGGDEVLGVEQHRIAPVTLVARDPSAATRHRLRRAAGALAPNRVRMPRLRARRLANAPRWLRPEAWERFMDAIDESEASQPRSFAASVRMVPRRRTQFLAARNRNLMAAPYDVVVRSPLLDPRFVTALAADGGFLGRGDRTAVLRAIASDVLPDELLARTSKASFTRAYMGRPTREFAADWDGTGLDPEVVDVDVVRELWRSGRPPAPTSSLLQAAWLATRSDEA